MAAITIRIPPELQTRLQKFCKRQHRSTSDVLRESLNRFLLAEQLREIRQELRPHAERAGFITDEDVFKAVS